MKKANDMIKRIVGAIGALGVVAIVVMTAVGHGGYSSMLPEDMFAVSAKADAAAGEEPGEGVRGSKGDVREGGSADRADSLSVAKPDAAKGRK